MHNCVSLWHKITVNYADVYGLSVIKSAKGHGLLKPLQVLGFSSAAINVEEKLKISHSSHLSKRPAHNPTQNF